MKRWSAVRAGLPLALLLLSAAGSGCVSTGRSTSRCEACARADEEDADDGSFNITPLIGLFGMAVDGDDRDDYADMVNGDDHDCRDSSHRRRH